MNAKTLELKSDNYLDVTFRYTGGQKAYTKLAQAEKIELQPWQSRDGNIKRVYVQVITHMSYRNNQLVFDHDFSGLKITIGYVDGNGYHPEGMDKKSDHGTANTKHIFEQRDEMIALATEMLNEME